MQLNAVYTSNEAYIEPAYLSMYSLLDNNEDIDNITIYYVCEDFSEKSKNLFIEMVLGFNRNIVFVEPPSTEILQEIKPMDFHISTYYRLFLSTLLPDSVNRIIYIDCDTTVVGSLKSLVEMDLGNILLAAGMANQETSTRRKLGLKDNMAWMNAGILVTDLNKWRARDIEKEFIAILEKFNWQVPSNDEGMLNIIMQGEFVRLHPKYNCLFREIFTENSVYKKIIKGFRGLPFYSLEEYRQAWTKPVIIHYAAGVFGRPWMEGATSSKKEEYLKYRNLTIFANKPLMGGYKLKYRYLVYEWMFEKSPFVYDSIQSFVLPAFSKMRKLGKCRSKI